MAKLEDILSEIRKGRRCRRATWTYYYGEVDLSADRGDIFRDDWELEPLPKKKVKLFTYRVPAGYSDSYHVILLENETRLNGSYRRIPWLDGEIEVDE